MSVPQENTYLQTGASCVQPPSAGDVRSREKTRFLLLLSAAGQSSNNHCLAPEARLLLPNVTK